MLTSAERQSQIKATLAAESPAISASKFAKHFGVSRQTVVGDVALLRAQGAPIIATPRGYVLEPHDPHQALIVCKHTPEQAEEEMRLVVENGGAMLDVTIDHPVYGQLRGQLQVRTEADIKLFMARLRQHGGGLLSELTGGVHMHTIAVQKPEQLKVIKDALRQAGFLIE